MALSIPDQLEDFEISEDLQIIKDRLTDLAAGATELAKQQAASIAADPEDVMNDVSDWARRPSTRTAAKYMGIGVLVGALVTAFCMRRRKRAEVAAELEERTSQPTSIHNREDAQAS